MSRTTIAIDTDTRARIKAGAAAEATTIDRYLRSVLDEHEKSRFWASLEQLTPDSYAAAVAQDGDTLDQNYAIEEQAVLADEN